MEYPVYYTIKMNRYPATYSENWNSTGAEIRVLDGDILKIIKNADWNNDVVSEEQFVI